MREGALQIATMLCADPVVATRVAGAALERRFGGEGVFGNGGSASHSMEL